MRLTGGEGRVLLFALGSRAGATEEQLARLREASPGLPVVDAPAGALDAGAVVRAAGSDRAPSVARVPASPRGEPGAVARSFASGVRAAIEGLGGPGRLAALAATGGDTVEAILDAFDLPALDVLGELRPGVPVSRAGCRERGAHPGEQGGRLRRPGPLRRDRGRDRGRDLRPLNGFAFCPALRPNPGMRPRSRQAGNAEDFKLGGYS